MPITSAIILAGGPGTRMWPYSDVRNKCALPIANVPNVRWLADSLAAIGVRRLVVVLGPHPGSIRSALVGCSVPVVYVEGSSSAGTAGAVLAGVTVLDDDRFVVVYGDTVTTEDNLRAVVEAPEAAGAALCDRARPGESPPLYGAQTENGRIQRITGQDRDGVNRLCGVFSLHRSIIPHLESNPGLMRTVRVGGMPPLEPDLAQSLNDWGEEIACVEATDFVVDLDKPWHILEANSRMSGYLTDHMTENRIHPTARIHDGAEIHGFVDLGENAEIGNRVVIKSSLIAGADTRIVNGAILGGANVIGERCRISDYCLLDSRTVIGSDCVVGHGAEMDGVAFDGAYLYHYCEICGVVGASVDIGAATVCGTLRFDDAAAEHRINGFRERPGEFANSTYFGDYSRTGVNVITMPGAKIGAYSCVGAGIVVYEDIPSRTLRLLKQETIDRPWGPERYGW